VTRRSTPQIDLFGTPAEASGGLPEGASPTHVAPVAVDDATRALAAGLPAQVHLGTSSWAFPGWQGLVYGRAERAERLSKHGLAAYAQHPLLRAVGLDRTFYAPIGREDFAAYAAAVPTDFRFLVKAHAAVTTPGGLARMRTHGAVDRFLDAAYATDVVIGPAVEGLGAALGVLLFQCPPMAPGSKALATFPDRLEQFLSRLPRGVPYGVEVRNASLLDDATVERYGSALRSGGATHGFTVHPSMPPVPVQAERLGEGAWAQGAVAVRWMLRPDQEYESAREAWAPFRELAAPDLGTRAEVAELVRTLAAAQRPVLVIANNKAEGSAPLTLRELARLLAGAAGRT
jgi:uncharacterized protein YecE (DUF72 family)